ncbi:uncharacterized protein LOC124821382 [Vigna umbellata]|uniref:uncharacterized protein LOC124821382 n=1 Tax=Vigna umbellata TaxID=87088 RepID=UPI001F5E52D1|nr:uncharacterized protein LOC124821382 [Vigna umbellata]
MGGGGAMRTAAKIAGIGVSKSGLRGSTAALPTEQSVRSASRSSSVAGVSAQGAKTAEVAPLHAASPWDDWDFADDSDFVAPRMVFGSAPTFEEAKEATTELKDAIDQIYLSPDSSKFSSPGDEVSTLSPTLYEPVNRSCVIDAISNPSVPKHAIQAFNLLSTSHEAQAVVASLASDPNVWNAVMENPAVYRFFQSQQTVSDSGAVETTEEVEKLSTFSSEGDETLEKMEATAESDSGSMFSDFMGFLQNLKLTVTELVSSVSSFLQNIFPSPDTQKMAADADGNIKSSFMGGTFIGLAVLVIMVIVTKRV